MPNRLVYISPSQKEFSGSRFALWRKLRFHRLTAEQFPIGEKRFLWIRLPITEDELPLLGDRLSSLLLSRIDERTKEGALCLLHPSLQGIPLFTHLPLGKASSHEIFSLTVGFLPEILSSLQRQWGLSLEGSSMALFHNGDLFLPIAEAIAPYARSLTVLGKAPSYHEQNAAWERWGLAVCTGESVPSDCSLIIRSDPSLQVSSVSKSVLSISLFGSQPNAVCPSHIYFRLPGVLSSLVAPLGGVTLETLPLLLRVFYEDDPSRQAAKRAGFSVSRITRPDGKFYG